MSLRQLFTHPIAFIAEGAVLLGIVLGRFELSVLGLLGWIGFAAFQSMKATQARQQGDPTHSLSNDARSRIGPIRRLVAEIERLVAGGAGNTALQVIGAEAIKEARSMLAKAAALAAARDDLERAVAQVSPSTEEGARALETANKGIADIDRALSQMEAGLADLRGRFALSIAQTVGAAQDQQSLEETLARLKALGSSLDEAESFLREGQR
ncbi:MAG: hypothetical protein HZC36_13445 [Armatimonadetes bacterium]|nr:hypothetical protein [Armatimonadota bacterium]